MAECPGTFETLATIGVIFASAKDASASFYYQPRRFGGLAILDCAIFRNCVDGMFSTNPLNWL